MDVKCKYIWPINRCSIGHQLYTCQVTSASITQSDSRTIQSFSGNHLTGKSNDDVVAVWFKKTVVQFFPQGLHRIFPNLISVRIDNCELKEITRDDLTGLQNLEMIYLANNQLTTLPSNLFQNMPKLKKIDFHINNLEFLSSKLMRPLMNNALTWVDFRKNKNINALYMNASNSMHPESVDTIEELNKIIDINCKVPEGETEERDEKEDHKVKTLQGLNKLWATRKFPDFSIFVGSKEFKVHKSVLSIHCSVFDRKDHANYFGLRNTSEKAVHDFLRYVYTGDKPEPKNAIEIFQLSFLLGVEELQLICERIICKNVMNDSNAWQIFMLGCDYASDAIKNEAFDRIKFLYPEAGLSDLLPEKLNKQIQIDGEGKIIKYNHQKPSIF